MTIILYDLCPSADRPGGSLSPNMWKVRYCLNYKNLPHESQFIEGPDIEPFYKSHGIAPTSTNPDGSPRYTLPFIYDPSTNKYISDSFAIAEYLDKTYPTPEPILPHATRGLQLPLEGAFLPCYVAGFKLLWRQSIPLLSPVTSEFLYAKNAPVFESADKIPRDVLWAEWKDGLNKVAVWYEKTEGPFLMGETLSWGDFVVAAYFMWL